MGVTINEIKALNAISGDKKKDSTFVRKALAALYKNDAEKLQERSVTGLQGHRKNNGVVKVFSAKKQFHQLKFQRFETGTIAESKDLRMDKKEQNARHQHVLIDCCKRPLEIWLEKPQWSRWTNGWRATTMLKWITVVNSNMRTPCGLQGILKH